MSRLTIDTGTAGNPATGDSLRTAFNKVNTNFTELYAELGGDSLDAISFNNNAISTDITNANLILTGNGTGGVVIEDIEINGSTFNVLTTNNNLTLNTNGTGKVVINGLSFPITDGTAGQVLKTDGAGNLSFTAVDPGAITIVGDDSSGTAINIGETFKIAGSGTVTTSVSGDTITITGSASAQGITFVGDDSTGTRVSDGESFKIAGSGSVTTAVSGDTLTITGSGGGIPLAGATYNLNANAGLAINTTDGGIDFLRNGVTGIGIRGEGLHIYAANSYILWDGSVLKFPSGSDIQRDDGNGSFVSVLGVPKTIDVNEISSGDSSAIQINDAVNVSGAGTFHGSVRFNAGYTEKINALTSSSTITVNCATASIHTVTLAVSTGFVISNLPTGGTVTLIITQGGSGSYTATFGTDGSTTVKFPGGAPTLSTAVGEIDVVTVFNDGTNYLGNIAKAYAA